MSPEETIRAAIARLEQQRDASTPGPWEAVGGTIDGGPYSSCEVVTSDVDCMSYCYGGTGRGIQNRADGALIVTLHRTIDAQLRILREAEYQLGKDAGFAAREYNLFLPLARAILGEDQ